MTDKLIREYIIARMDDEQEALEEFVRIGAKEAAAFQRSLLGNNAAIIAFIDSIQEEPVSEDLEKAARSYSIKLINTIGRISEQTKKAFKIGAKWQEEKDNEEKVLTYRHGFNDCKEHIKEVLLSEVLPFFMHGGEADEVVAKLDEVLN